MSHRLADEEHVAGFLTSHGLVAERISESDPRSSGKTPDFQVSTKGGALFFCEVKSLEPSFGLDAFRHDTLFNTMSHVLHQAAKQFRAVNEMRMAPNILAWVSHNFRVTCRDLDDLIQGRITVEGTEVTDLRKHRGGLIKNDVDVIDLHLWFQDRDAPHFAFHYNDDRHHRQLCNAFGLDPAAVSPPAWRWRKPPSAPSLVRPV